MQGKPKLLDLFCGAGGASWGYYLVGFQPYGIDNKPQPHYPFPFLQMDALEAMDRLLRGEGLTFSNGEILYLKDFVAYHASPPCQAFSEITPPESKKKHPKMIKVVHNIFVKTSRPYAIENVEGARWHLINPIMLCGSMFGLKVWRHRWFEVYPTLFMSPFSCQHIGRPFVVNAGSNARKNRLPVLVTGTTRRKTGRFEYGVEACREAMNIDWMTRTELDQAIPPAYTEYIGKYLMRQINESQR